MKSDFRPALVLLLAFTLITGFAYPLLVTGFASVVFPGQAKGSLIVRDGRPIGSTLIGQGFSSPKYFWGRPSATTPMPYNALGGSGSNQGPMSPTLADAVKTRIGALRAADPDQTAPIPVDLVTASASGLDPHISPAAAYWQVSRVARVRGLSQEKVEALVTGYVETRTLGVLGEPRVNVLELNLALDSLSR